MESLQFFNHTRPQLRAKLVELGHERFRADQLFRWAYGRGITDISQMTDMSKKVRADFQTLIDFRRPATKTHHVSTDGTQKFLFDVGDNDTVEAVLIPSEDRMTLCVSSEIGCNIGCKFCFTGKQKMKRRLTTAEIVGQLLGAKETLSAQAEGARASAPDLEAQWPNEKHITNIVFMGMGEPLDNPDAVFDSIEIFHEPLGLNMSKKKITVSTSGIVPLMPRVSESGARLAVSLNGVNDEVRTRIMPINKKWPIADLMQACKEYYAATGDRITFEYVLLKGVTDSVEDARALHKLAGQVPSKINIIPFNEHPGSGFYRPEETQIRAFQEELMRLGSHVLRRKTMGRDIYAACGQLRTAYKDHPGRFDTTAVG